MGAVLGGGIGAGIGALAGGKNKGKAIAAGAAIGGAVGGVAGLLFAEHVVKEKQAAIATESELRSNIQAIDYRINQCNKENNALKAAIQKAKENKLSAAEQKKRLESAEAMENQITKDIATARNNLRSTSGDASDQLRAEIQQLENQRSSLASNRRELSRYHVRG